MIRHLFKMVWNRKRSNLLLMLEIFLAFLVVFAVTTASLFFHALYTRPLGFDWRDVWVVEIGRPDMSDAAWQAGDAEIFQHLVREVGALQPVQVVASGTNGPYGGSVSQTMWEYKGRPVTSEVGWGSDELADAMRIDLVAGRWFEPADAALGFEPAVINQALARELYGDEDPVGQRVNYDEAQTDLRVVGVVRDYRHRGELTRSDAFFFRRAGQRDDGYTQMELMLRLEPGTTAAFEEELTERLHAVAPDWTFRVESLELRRQDHFTRTLAPLVILAIVASFLLLMVVLGLTGVLWQNVTRRTREIGLRRAVGACRGSVHRQIVAEVMITAAFALVLGTLVAIQLPAFGPLSFVPFGLVLGSVAVSCVVIVLLAGACGLYPGWTATRIRPAEALHHE